MKTQCILTDRRQLSDTVWELHLTTHDVLDYTAGQFMILEIMPNVRRTFSIVSLTHNQTGSSIVFIVKAAPGGATALWLEQYSGGKIVAIGPSGRFSLVPSDLRRVFVATGTGIAPFVPLIKKAFNHNSNAVIDLYFGVKTIKDNYAQQYFTEELSTHPNFRYFLCLSDEKQIIQAPAGVSGLFYNNVSGVVPFQYTDLSQVDVYICGIPAMVLQLEEILRKEGVNAVYTEKYV